MTRMKVLKEAILQACWPRSDALFAKSPTRSSANARWPASAPRVANLVPHGTASCAKSFKTLPSLLKTSACNSCKTRVDRLLQVTSRSCRVFAVYRSFAQNRTSRSSCVAFTGREESTMVATGYLDARASVHAGFALCALAPPEALCAGWPFRETAALAFRL